MFIKISPDSSIYLLSVVKLRWRDTPHTGNARRNPTVRIIYHFNNNILKDSEMERAVFSPGDGAAAPELRARSTPGDTPG